MWELKIYWRSWQVILRQLFVESLRGFKRFFRLHPSSSPCSNILLHCQSFPGLSKFQLNLLPEIHARPDVGSLFAVICLSIDVNLRFFFVFHPRVGALALLFFSVHTHASLTPHATPYPNNISIKPLTFSWITNFLLHQSLGQPGSCERKFRPLRPGYGDKAR